MGSLRSAVFSIALLVCAAAGAQEDSPIRARDRRHSPRGPRLEAAAATGEVRLRGAGGKVELAVRLLDASAGGIGLRLDRDAAPREQPDGVEFVRSAEFLETYTLVSSGVEQSFRIERPSQLLSGGLAIRVGLELNGVPATLAPDRHGYRILGDIDAGVRMSPVSVIDASGEIFAAAVRSRSAGEIEITLPAAVVSRLAWPIVVDPFIDLVTFVNVAGGVTDDTEPDCAHDTLFLDAHLVAWRTEFAPGDHDILYNLVERDPNSGLRGPVLVDREAFPFSNEDEGRPRVAFLNDGSFSVYGIVFDTVFAPGDHDVAIALVQADGTLLGTKTDVAFTTDDEKNPAIGADPVTGQFLVVWERFDGSQSDIVGRTVDAKGNYGPEFTISKEGFVANSGLTSGTFANPSNQTSPAVSARPVRPGGSARDAWAVVYVDDSRTDTSGFVEPHVVCAFVPTDVAPSAPTAVAHIRTSSSGDKNAAPDVAACMESFNSGSSNFSFALVANEVV